MANRVFGVITDLTASRNPFLTQMFTPVMLSSVIFAVKFPCSRWSYASSNPPSDSNFPICTSVAVSTQFDSAYTPSFFTYIYIYIYYIYIYIYLTLFG